MTTEYVSATYVSCVVTMAAEGKALPGEKAMCVYVCILKVKNTVRI